MEECRKAAADAKALAAKKAEEAEELRNKKGTIEKEITSVREQLAQKSDTDKVRLETEYAQSLAKKGETDRLLQQISSLAEHERELSHARETYRLAAEESDRARAEYTSLERAYFDGIAGILGETLTNGDPCPVCGSVHHPSPARRNQGVPDREALDRKRNEVSRLSEAAKVLSEKAGQLSGICETERKAILRAVEALFAVRSDDVQSYRNLAKSAAGALTEALSEIGEKLRLAEREEAERASLTDRLERFALLLTETAEKAEAEAIAAARLEAEQRVLAEKAAELSEKLEFSGKEGAEQALSDLEAWVNAYEEAKTSATTPLQ